MRRDSSRRFVLLAAATVPNVATARASAPSFCGELGGDWDGQYCHTSVTSERNAVRDIKVARARRARRQSDH